MNIHEDNLLKIIKKIFQNFHQQTESDNSKFSRDYFERFTQLLTQTFFKYPQYQSTIEEIISFISYPYHSSNSITLEYQLRLIRYSFRQHLSISIHKQTNFLNELFYHKLLQYSSILRYLTLQIAILVNEQIIDHECFIYIIKQFSFDRNLYVRNSLVEFFVVYLSKNDSYELFEYIKNYSNDSDLIYQILIQLNTNQQEFLIKQYNLYDNLSDTTAQRIFILKTSIYLDDENPIIFYLNHIFDKSLSDYIHMLLTIISSRENVHRSNEKLKKYLQGIFLYMQDIEIEEIDEIETNILTNENELCEYICCRLYERNINVNELISIVIDGIQPFISDLNSFIYQLDFYQSIILKLFHRENDNDKTFAQIIICLDKIQHRINENLIERLIEYINNKKKRSILVYQAFFNYILHSTDRIIYFEKIQFIIELLLFEKLDSLYQWDHQDSVLYFLKQLSQTYQYPSWFTNNFLQRIIEQFVHSNNEYIQESLINFLLNLIEQKHLSSLDNYLITNFIQLTKYSLGNIVRCALAHGWFIILIQSRNSNQYHFSFGLTIDRNNLLNILIEQIPLLIGDGSYETEIQCLHLIELLNRKNEQINQVLEYLFNDGCSNEIKEYAARLLGKSLEIKTNELIEDEFQTVLHWLEHPDEHMILDCD